MFSYKIQIFLTGHVYPMMITECTRKEDGQSKVVNASMKSCVVASIMGHALSQTNAGALQVGQDIAVIFLCARNLVIIMAIALVQINALANADGLATTALYLFVHKNVKTEDFV